MYYEPHRDAQGREDGLMLHLERRRPRGRSRWRVEVARARTLTGELAYVLRFMAGGVPCCWVRIDDWWENYWGLREPSAEAASCAVVRPLRREDVTCAEEAREREGERGWRVHWERFFAQELLHAPVHDPLWDGETRWHLRFEPGERLRDVSAATRWIEAGSAPTFHVDGYELPAGALPLRRLSHDDEGRLKWMRKLEKSSLLPPVLTLYVRPLGQEVVLDGHERLHAALLAGVEPDRVVLTPMRRLLHGADIARAMQEGLERMLSHAPVERFSERSMRGLNEAAITAYRGHDDVVVMRGFAMEGGVRQWRHEVMRRGRQLVGEQEEVAATLIHGLEEQIPGVP